MGQREINFIQTFYLRNERKGTHRNSVGLFLAYKEAYVYVFCTNIPDFIDFFVQFIYNISIFNKELFVFQSISDIESQ